MKLETYLKWRINELLALRALPKDGENYRRRFKSLCADAMPVCAAELKAAPPGSSLYGAGRTRKFWATLGYAAIVLFLATVAAFILSYWLVTERRVPWLSSNTLFMEAGLAVAEIGLMLLCANRVTAVQNAHVRRTAEIVLPAFDALPPEEADFIVRTLSQAAEPRGSEQHCGCCACGAVFRFADHPDADPASERCPLCGAEYQLVFEAPELPLDARSVNRLQSFLGK